jgi:hypothetical protein
LRSAILIYVEHQRPLALIPIFILIRDGDGQLTAINCALGVNALNLAQCLRNSTAVNFANIFGRGVKAVIRNCPIDELVGVISPAYS